MVKSQIAGKWQHLNSLLFVLPRTHNIGISTFTEHGSANKYNNCIVYVYSNFIRYTVIQ